MLNQKSQSLPKMQLHLSPSYSRCALGCVCLLGLALLSACGKSPVASSPKTSTAPASPQPVASSRSADAKLDDEINKALATRQSDLTAQAEDILASHPDKNAADLLGVPEVNAKLKIGLQKLGDHPELQKRINSTVELAAKLKGLEGTPGSARLDLDIKSYDRTRTTRMLETVLSEDPKRIVGFLVEEIGEAAPELSFGGAERASNGIAIENNPTPPPPPQN